MNTKPSPLATLALLNLLAGIDRRTLTDAQRDEIAARAGWSDYATALRAHGLAADSLCPIKGAA